MPLVKEKHQNTAKNLCTLLAFKLDDELLM